MKLGKGVKKGGTCMISVTLELVHLILHVDGLSHVHAIHSVHTTAEILSIYRENGSHM